MSNLGVRPITVVAVGAGPLDDILSAFRDGSDRDMRIEQLSPDVVLEDGRIDPETDCLVVDGRTTDRELLKACVDEPVPVTYLETSAADRRLEALSVGVDGTLPRELLHSEKALLVDRVIREIDPGRLGDGRRKLFENVADGLVYHDPQTGIIRDVNERFCEMNGYSREELVGERIGVVTADGDDYSNEAARERVQRAYEEGSQLFEWRNQRKDGTEFPVEVHLQIVQRRGTEQVLASVRDISERKRRERSLERERDRRSLLFETNPDPIIEVEFEGGRPTILDVNDAFEGVFGFNAESIGGRTVAEALVPPSEREEYEQLLERTSSGEAVQCEVRRAVKDDVREFLLRIIPFELPGGEQRAYVWYTDITDRKRRERELAESERRLEAILDRIDEAIFFARAQQLAEPSPEPDFVSSGYEQIWGQPLAKLHETHEDGFFGTLHPEERPDYSAFIDDILRDIEAQDSENRYSREYRIERPDGETRWVHSDYYPVTWEDEPPRVVVVSRDVTDRKARERRIASFDEATDELRSVDTIEEATEQAVAAATENLGLAAVGTFLYDDEQGVLRPDSSAPALPDGVTDDPIEPDDGPLWEAFATGRIATSESGSTDSIIVDPDQETSPILDLQEWRGFPLSNHGLLLVGAPDSSLDSDTIQAAHVLAATLEAALNSLDSRRRLAAQKQQLRTQTRRADRLDEITRLTRRVEAAITDASDPGEIERAVCERLVGPDRFELAWIGGVDVGTDTMTARAIVGNSSQYVDRMALQTTADSPDTHPALDAWHTGEVELEESLVGDGPTGDWRQRALTEGYQSLCAIPLTYDGLTHGVLTVGAGHPDAFTEQEREILAQLGSSIGYALAATERRRALESDETVELEFAGQNVDLPFARTAREAGCRIVHERTVPRGDGTVSVSFQFEGDVPDEPLELAERYLPGDLTLVTDEGSGTVIETRTTDWFGAPIAEFGGILRTARATPEETVLTVEVAQQADVRAFVDRITEIADSLDLIAKRQHLHRDRSPTQLSSQIEAELTDRQLEVVRTALAAGYFEWPRENDGNEVADRLDITQPTLNKHLRLAERKLFELLFDTSS